MHKKTERNNYALASSNISDIPLSIDKKELQTLNRYQTADFKQNSSIYHAFNQSRSRAEESLSLHFSTARPFYGQVEEDYYNKRELHQKANYNKQQKEHYNMQKIKNKKSPNKKLMIYSYSNIVQFQKKIEKIFIDLKKRIFTTLCRVKKEQKMLMINGNKKNASFYSGQTNNTSREEALYRVIYGLRKEDRHGYQQQILQGVNIIEAWFQYRLLLDKRKTFNNIFQFGNDRKKFSLELSQSLKVENNHNQNYFLTDYNHSNEISLTHGLPQQIQESLVYTLEHNNESTRKQFTQSTLEKFPTLKNYPSSTQMKQKLSSRQIESQTSKKNSPMYKLKPFSSSHTSQKDEIYQSSPLNLKLSFIKNNSINIDQMIDLPLECQFEFYQKQNKINEHEETIQLNDINGNISCNDEHQLNNIDADLNRITLNNPNRHQQSRVIQNSAKYSDVSNYKMENTVHKQQQTNPFYSNYTSNHPNQQIVQDQTVLRKPASLPFDEKNTPAKFQKYYVSAKQVYPAIATPKFTSEIHFEDQLNPLKSQQKLVSQLDNDRIRIFGKAKQQNPRQPILIPTRITKLRGNFSPNAPHLSPPILNPITISSDKRIFSPKIQTERHFQNQPFHNQVPLQQPTSLRLIEQPIRYPKINHSPDYQIQRPIIQHTLQHQTKLPQQKMVQIPINTINQRGEKEQNFKYAINKEIVPMSPRNIGPNIVSNKMIIRKESPQNRIIQKGMITSPQKSINQQKQLQPKETIYNYQREDYGYASNMPQQKPQYTIINKINPSQKHLVNVQKQYQLPTQIRIFKPQSPPLIAQPQTHRENFQMKEKIEIEKKIQGDKVRPQSTASSPKLFFNYKPNHESHIDEEIIVNSNHITKNSSSISRPKSMNSKLFVTLRKEL